MKGSLEKIFESILNGSWRLLQDIGTDAINGEMVEGVYG